VQKVHHKIAAFSRKFKSVITNCERYCFAVRGTELQESACIILGELKDEAIALKEEAIAQQFEDGANKMLSYQQLIIAVTSELRMWMAIKRGDPAEAWNSLTEAQSAVRDAMLASEVASNLDGYVEKLYALEQLVFPPLLFFSVGGVIKESKCSICGNDYENCEHLKGKPYMGQICSRIITSFHLKEISIVDEPANKRARAISMTDEEGNRRDIMTWRIIEEASAANNGDNNDDSSR